MEKVSVVIPAYNAERFISDAIESVLSQTHQNVECIVVDDGSTDATKTVVEKFGNRVNYLYQNNSERSAARNFGISASSGDYISFLDADDSIAPKKIETQVQFLLENNDFDVVYSDTLHFKDFPERKFYHVKRPCPSGDILSVLAFRNVFTVNSPLIGRPVLEKSGGFDPYLSFNEDWDFWLRLSLAGAKFGYLDETLSYCRTHQQNTSQQRLRMYESKYEIIKKLTSEFSSEFRVRGIKTAEVVAFHQADYGRGLILHGEKTKGQAMIKEACRDLFPFRWLFKLFSVSSTILGTRILARIQRTWSGEL